MVIGPNQAHAIDENRWLTGIDYVLHSPDTHFMRIATLGGVVIGYTAAEALVDAPATNYRGLFVAQEYWGKGLAHELEDTRAAWADATGRPSEVRVAPANIRSQRFFLSRGFKPIAYEDADPARNSPDLIVMAKPVTGNQAS